MSDDQFDRIIARIDGLQAEMEARFASVEHRLERIEAAVSDIATVLIAHLADHQRGTP